LFQPPEVVVLGPVAREFAQERDLDPLRGILDELGGGPAHRLDAATQVIDLLVRDLDAEGPDPGCSLRGGAHEYLPCGSASTERSECGGHLLPSCSCRRSGAAAGTR